MSLNLDFPNVSREELGDLLSDAMDDAELREQYPIVKQADAVREYLKGNRHFDVIDPWNPAYKLLVVDLPIDQPALELLVSDHAREMGRQLRVDVRPAVKPVDLSLQALKDASVAYGTLLHYLPESIVKPVHQEVQRLRLEAGCVGIAVSETEYPGTGWGVQLHVIHPSNLLFLPAGVGWCDVNDVVWRRWVPYNWLKNAVSRANSKMGTEKIRLPGPNSADWEKLEVVECPPGQSPGYGPKTEGLPLSTAYNGTRASSVEAGQEKRVKWVKFAQHYVTNDRRHCERKIWMAGRFIMWDKEYAEGEQPIIPIGRAVFADCGTPYGRSYDFPKMMALLGVERIATKLAKNVDDLDTYGTILSSTAMNLDLEQLARPSNGGFRHATYAIDAVGAGQQPIQFEPAPFGRIVGSVPQFLAALAGQVYPSTPLFQGKSPGRVDSNAAIESLDDLSMVEIKAGAETVAAAWSQVMAAVLELARKHHRSGDTIPLTYVDDSMAGIILDTMNLPQSQSEKEESDIQRERKAYGLLMRGEDPLLSMAMQGEDEPQSEKVPLPRFRIGPNVIPHPDSVACTIRSILPRNEEKELADLKLNVQTGLMSITEMQITAYKQGLPGNFGGKSAFYAYQLAIMNLLSVFGDGVESGPFIPPVTGGNQGIGAWVFATFVESPVFALASKEVKKRVLQGLEWYGGNLGTANPTADEIAEQQVMRMAAQMQQMNQGQPAPRGPRPPAGGGGNGRPGSGGGRPALPMNRG